MSLSLISSPYLWTALGALFWGLALGQALLWTAVSVSARRLQRGREELPSIRPGALARVSTFASLGILGLAGLLVLPAKTSLADGYLFGWALGFLLAGLIAGLLPRAGSLLVLCVLAAAVILLRVGCAGFRSYAGEVEIARLLPLVVPGSGGDSALFTAEFREEDDRSRPSPRTVELPRSGAALLVEGLELRGPLAFLGAFPSASSDLRLFRLAGFGGGPSPALRFERKTNLLDHIAGLDEGAPPAPGAPPLRRSLFGGLLERSLGLSRLPPITLLEPVVYSIGSDLAPRLQAPAGDVFGVLSR